MVCPRTSSIKLSITRVVCVPGHEWFITSFFEMMVDCKLYHFCSINVEKLIIIRIELLQDFIEWSNWIYPILPA